MATCCTPLVTPRPLSRAKRRRASGKQAESKTTAKGKHGGNTGVRWKPAPTRHPTRALDCRYPRPAATIRSLESCVPRFPLRREQWWPVVFLPPAAPSSSAHLPHHMPAAITTLARALRRALHLHLCALATHALNCDADVQVAEGRHGVSSAPRAPLRSDSSVRASQATPV